MYSLFSRYIGHNLIDLLKNTKTLKIYNNLLDLTPEEETRLQLSKLKSLLKHSIKYVPYYRKNVNLNEDLINKCDNINYLLSFFPILTKDTVRQNLSELISDNSYKAVKYDSSSGTTGVPLKFISDPASFGYGYAMVYLQWRKFGFQPGDKFLNIWGNLSYSPKSIKSRIGRYLRNEMFVFSPELTTNNLKYIYERIILEKPKVITGYSSSILIIARYLLKMNLKLNYKPLLVSTTAESILPQQTNIIKQAFECEVKDYYGFSEINGVAYQDNTKDIYKIFKPHVIVEPKDETNIYQKIIVTDLDNYQMPFIRYEPGDVAEFNNDSGEIIINKILGRNLDIIKLKDGIEISVISFFGGAVFRKINKILRHQVNIKNPSKIIFNFNVSEELNHQEKEYINEYIKSVLKENSFIINYNLGDNPNYYGKIKFTVR